MRRFRFSLPPVHVFRLFGLPARPGGCFCLLDIPHDRRAHPR
ncbi:hypothetical protein ACIBG8_51545 [Nonomuraea sp. NPDC050556]